MNVLRGLVCLTLIVLNTFAACVPLYVMGLVRLFLRGAARRRMNGSMDRIIDYWVGCNRLLFRAFDLTRVRVHVEGEHDLARDRWYLVICNHQSWADILILQTTFRELIPPIKFFTKQQLIWIPLLGVAMWLLGFPYVRRMSREQIAANPDLVALDREATLQACAGFRDHPTTVLNFLEGTRFTPEKHAAQDARFRNLLNPKLGGMSYVVYSLSDQLYRVLDVTIDYPHGIPTFWELMQGHCQEVDFLVQCRELPEGVRGASDPDTVRALLAPWVEQLWREKDSRLRRASAGPAPVSDPAT
jgi:1-acyl-sn-glycerol-3-phosphate acyltransferase